MDIPTAEARKQFSEILNRAAYAKERVVLTRRGKPLAAIVPIEDIEALEAMEDRIDIEEADEVIARNEEGIPFDEIKRKYGLR
ncbi:MAG: type II toxin-antitoxin system Phd/YefM family antitoxin [Syntrophobacteraceae bacterium]|nr:type II toxin-antitoxin system Phd/YefM family antitoxin [Syntrophobacteraceae bacterium]